MTVYIGSVALLSAVSLYITTLPMFIKLIGVGILLFYSYLLFMRDLVKHFSYLGDNQFQCEMGNGAVYIATLADDSIFLRWFILLRFIITHNRKSYSVILFKRSKKFSMAQQIKQQVLFHE